MKIMQKTHKYTTSRMVLQEQSKQMFNGLQSQTQALSGFFQNIFTDFKLWNLGPCSGLNRIGPDRLLCLNAWPSGSDTNRRCVLVRMGVLEKMCHCRDGL